MARRIWTTLSVVYSEEPIYGCGNLPAKATSVGKMVSCYKYIYLSNQPQQAVSVSRSCGGIEGPRDDNEQCQEAR